jgi:serine/threonine-protein kinase
MAITLTVIDGPHQGNAFSFDDPDTFLVGRSDEAHFRLAEKDSFISRVHFLVEMNPPLCRLVDMNSQNGTYLNGERVQAAELKNGDRIQAGRTVFQVAISAPPTDTDLEQAVAGMAVANLHDTVEYTPRVAAAPTPTANAQKVKTIAGYRLVKELGRGSMGVVYLAERESDKTRVALKTITPAAATSRVKLNLFLREAEILRQLNHPNIVACRESGVAEGRIYFVMDYVQGITAADLLERHGPLQVRPAVRLLCQLLGALEYAHAQGFVHRDIKPGNILVPRIAGARTVKLTDFGLARAYRGSQLSGLTTTGSISGTIPFMPAEQILSFRKAQPATDQYSAAATLYNLLTGKYVYDFPNNTVEALSLILNERPVPIQQRRGDIPTPLAGLIHRALAHKPDDRFPSVREMRMALLPFAQ